MAKNGYESGLQNLKNEVASEMGVHFNEGYNGDLSSRQCGSVGGGMVKKMVENYKGSTK
ncbi:alpha/beta-type small acid-soluble spore protein [Clostridium sp.]|uniref:alpha/beta-type small acid-soluble spore protein n=1 Tax=Clostridium sp. TaxID=1506 RepID=UPI00262ABAFF|nr:alpha/beta-type small acid-soluble spore protein [Clostridium sp.]